MKYRLTKEDLVGTLKTWNGFLRKKIHLIACGGTALTLLEIKESTKDVDFIIPIEAEYAYLLGILKDLGYKQLTPFKWRREEEIYEFDLFLGKHIHTTELLESPLDKGNHKLLIEFSYLYIGVLNYYDLIISKLFRSSTVDIDDCLDLIRERQDQIDIESLRSRYIETAKYNSAEERMIKNLDSFLKLLEKENLYDG